MKSLSKILKVILVGVFTICLSSNGYSQTGEKMKRGAGQGAALGALAGVVFGNGNILQDAAGGAIRGAAAGAAVGLISGEVEKSKTRKAEKERLEQEKSAENSLIAQFGRDNIEAYYALLDKNYSRSFALASAGETSNDANHRVAAVWIKAMIAIDQQDKTAADKEFERLIVLDPIIDTRDQAKIETDKLVLEMRKERLAS